MIYTSVRKSITVGRRNSEHASPIMSVSGKNVHHQALFKVSLIAFYNPRIKFLANVKYLGALLRTYLASSRSNNKDAIASACSSSVMSAFMRLRSAIILSNSSATKSVQTSFGAGYKATVGSSWISVVVSLALFEEFLK